MMPNQDLKNDKQGASSHRVMEPKNNTKDSMYNINDITDNDVLKTTRPLKTDITDMPEIA